MQTERRLHPGITVHRPTLRSRCAPVVTESVQVKEEDLVYRLEESREEVGEDRVLQTLPLQVPWTLHRSKLRMSSPRPSSPVYLPTILTMEHKHHELYNSRRVRSYHDLGNIGGRVN